MSYMTLLSSDVRVSSTPLSSKYGLMRNWGTFLLSHPRFSTWGKPAFSYLSSTISSFVLILSIFYKENLATL